MSDTYPSKEIKFCPFCRGKSTHQSNGEHRCHKCKKVFKVCRVQDTYSKTSTDAYQVHQKPSHINELVDDGPAKKR